MNDSYRHKGMRKKLIASVRRKGIRDEQVLEAMMRIPRHLFLDKAFEEKAYEDRPFPIGNDQTISQPYTVAYQTQLLEIQKRDKVLEIGTGSGYQAAVLSEMGARVFTIERFDALYQHTKKLLFNMGYERIRLFCKDGFKGLPEFAPFDKIIVTAGAPEIPEKLLEQLAVGGIFVIPVDSNSNQVMYKIRKTGSLTYEREACGDFIFVPMLKGIVK